MLLPHFGFHRPVIGVCERFFDNRLGKMGQFGEIMGPPQSLELNGSRYCRKNVAIEEDVSLTDRKPFCERTCNREPIFGSGQKDLGPARSIDDRDVLLRAGRASSSKLVKRFPNQCRLGEHESTLAVGAGPKPTAAARGKERFAVPRGVDDAVAAFAPPAPVGIVGNKPKCLLATKDHRITTVVPLVRTACIIVHPARARELVGAVPLRGDGLPCPQAAWKRWCI